MEGEIEAEVRSIPRFLSLGTGTATGLAVDVAVSNACPLESEAMLALRVAEVDELLSIIWAAATGAIPDEEPVKLGGACRKETSVLSSLEWSGDDCIWREIDDTGGEKKGTGKSEVCVCAVEEKSAETVSGGSEKEPTVRLVTSIGFYKKAIPNASDLKQRRRLLPQPLSSREYVVWKMTVSIS